MSTELAEYEPQTALVAEEPHQGELVASGRTVDEWRTEAIGQALESAYAKASMLAITPEEAEALGEDFPDEAFRTGAQGKSNLIYIEHAYLRQRLNKVLGIGSSFPIQRRAWTENFDYWKDGKKKQGVRIYVDLVLVVRGSAVGDAIGDAEYYPDNASTSYSDALESAKSAAFRRCAKEFGIGLQAWMKGWSEGWMDRNRGAGKRPAAPQQQQRNQSPAQPAPQTATYPTAQAPPATFDLPKDWPDTQVHDLKLWIDTFTSNGQFKQALGLFLNEPSLVGQPQDWGPVLRHYAATYKAKAATVATPELTAVIKAALDKLANDEAAEAALDQEAEQRTTMTI